MIKVTSIQLAFQIKLPKLKKSITGINIDGVKYKHHFLIAENVAAEYGQSGSAVYDPKGNLVGIQMAIQSTSNRSAIVPAKVIQKFMYQCKRN